MSRCCVRCGFLAGRDPRTRALEEVEEESRNVGVKGVTVNGNVCVIPLAPICFVMRSELTEQIIAHNGKVQAALASEHECPQFTEWHQGFTPKEHKEMLLDIEDKRLAASEKERERQHQDINKRNDRIFQVFLLLLGVALGTFFKSQSPPAPVVNVQPVQQKEAK